MNLSSSDRSEWKTCITKLDKLITDPSESLKLMPKFWRYSESHGDVLFMDLIRRINQNVPDSWSLDDIIMMLDDKPYPILFDHPSREVGLFHSYGEGSSSNSEAPHDVSNDGSAVDEELPKYGKKAFDDTDDSYHLVKELKIYGSIVFPANGISGLGGKNCFFVSRGSNGTRKLGGEEVADVPLPRSFSFHPTAEEFVAFYSSRPVDSFDYNPRYLPRSSNVEDKEWFFCERGRNSKGGPIHSYGEGSSSNSEAPHDVSNDGSAADKELPRGVGVREFNDPALKELIRRSLPQLLKEHIIDMPDQQAEDPIENEHGYYKTISKATVAITVPAAVALLNSAISGLSDDPSWNEISMVVATVMGFVLTVVSIGLNRVERPIPSGIMIKLGAISTASAIILALGLTVPPAVAWIAGAVSFLLILIGVAMA